MLVHTPVIPSQALRRLLHVADGPALMNEPGSPGAALVPMNATPPGTRIADLPAPGLYYVAGRLRDNLSHLAALQDREPRVSFAYAVKACTLAPILRSVASANLAFEVQSLHELERARDAGGDPARALWNSPRKTRRDIERALRLGVMVIVDSLSEAHDVAELAALDPTAGTRIGIRVSAERVDGYFSAHAHKLGMPDDEAAQAVTVLRAAGTPPRLLHCHGLARAATLEEYGRFVDRVASAVASIQRSTDHLFDIVDLGGGFDARSRLAAGDLDIDDFVKIACARLLDGAMPAAHRLIFEPGRYVVEDAAFALTRIVRRKVRDGRQWLVADISTNLLIPLPLARFEVVGETPDGMPTTIVDGTCSPAGVLVGECRMPALHEGEVITLHGCGAYSAALVEPFLEPPAPIRWLDSGGPVNIVSPEAASLASDFLQGFASTAAATAAFRTAS